jgi:hypothetical protein
MILHYNSLSVLQIIRGFCQWLENIDGGEKSTMTEGKLQQLFDIGFDVEAPMSPCVRSRELPLVAESAAGKRNLSQVSSSTARKPRLLHSQFL